jgi:hypothetical protein
MWPHLTSADIALIVGLRALWKAPEWGMKVLALAHAIRCYRQPPDVSGTGAELDPKR